MQQQILQREKNPRPVNAVAAIQCHDAPVSPFALAPQIKPVGMALQVVTDFEARKERASSLQ
jgi:hypothetical protein